MLVKIADSSVNSMDTGVDHSTNQDLNFAPYSRKTNPILFTDIT